MVKFIVTMRDVVLVFSFSSLLSPLLSPYSVTVKSSFVILILCCLDLYSGNAISFSLVLGG